MLVTGVIGSSRKPDERRVPIHPWHLERLDEALQRNLRFERGYGKRFGMGDERLAGLCGGLADRDTILARADAVILPKPVPADLACIREGGVVWGWPHCVQQRELTQVAIDRRLTLIAWEAMFHWSASGDQGTHVFGRNNELAGYCGVIHALELLGLDGHFGPPRRAAILGFGSVSRGAAYALQGRGVTEITLYTQRPHHLVSDRLFAGEHLQMRRGATSTAPMEAVAADGGVRPLLEALAEVDVIVNGTLQDTDAPLMFLRPGEESALRPGTLIVDVSCDLGMGFPFARPTSFAEPILEVGRVSYYAVDHTPSYLWDAASWEISDALLPYLGVVMGGPDAWAASETIRRAIEVRDGVIQNPKILSFQQRDGEYPHRAGG